MYWSTVVSRLPSSLPSPASALTVTVIGLDWTFKPEQVDVERLDR